MWPTSLCCRCTVILSARGIGWEMLGRAGGEAKCMRFLSRTAYQGSHDYSWWWKSWSVWWLHVVGRSWLADALMVVKGGGGSGAHHLVVNSILASLGRKLVPEDQGTTYISFNSILQTITDNEQQITCFTTCSTHAQSTLVVAHHNSSNHRLCTTAAGAFLH